MSPAPKTSTRRKARPKEVQPIKFVPVERAFKAQIKFLPNRDLNGWVDRTRRIKFHAPANRVTFLDEDTARVWQAKGYGQILDGTVTPVSPDELAELTSNDSTISL